VLGFCQGTLPAVDQAGRLLLAGPDRLASFPDGHGGLYRALLASGTLDALEARGVEHLFVFQVDNPLVPVLDPAFLGHHALAGSEFSFLAVRKAEPREKVAVFASQPDGCPVIVEYLDLPERFVRESERFCAGNIAIYAISCGFARRVALEGGLPVHRSLKKVPHWEPGRGLNTPGEPNAFKLECFLFDALPRARRHLVVEFEREAAFAPIKNPTGVDSAESAARLLRRRALALLAEAGFPAGEVPPGRPVELAPGFLVDPGALRERLLRGPRPEPSGAGPLVLD
jgi:UDP-N-acetylglucosamine/UDP-N-acetylgalactosamine diphosphorylase